MTKPKPAPTPDTALGIVYRSNPDDVVVVGVDPGNDGGIAVLSLAGTVLDTWRMPVIKGGRTELDAGAVCNLLSDVEVRHDLACVAIERVTSMPHQGIASTFNFGYGAGLVFGIAVGLRLPVRLVLPGEWQRVLAGEPRSKAKAAARRKADDKMRAVRFASKYWPKADLRGSVARTAKPSSGICDALCLAEYARRQAVGSE